MDAGRKALLMTYCHLDDLSAEDETLLERFYYEAVGYMRGAGVDPPDAAADPERAAMYDTCVDALVLDAWDNRRPSVTGQLFENPVWNLKKNQLKLTEPPVSESDTTE